MIFGFALFLLFGYSQRARAQLCQGSHIYLTVRDPSGRVIDPTPLTTRRLLTRTFDFVGVEEVKLTGDRNGAAATSVKALVFSSEGCTFGPLEEATFKLQGQTMRLIFRHVKRVRDRSAFYTIDLPPFSQGTFEIDLSRPKGLLSDPAGLTSPEGGWSFNFSAVAWRKTSKAAPDLPEPHSLSLRGMVRNSSTRLPMSGVKVELLLGHSGKEVYPASVTTDSNGRFGIVGVSDEQIIKSDRVSVRARAEGFAATQVYISNHRRLAQSRKILDHISMELRPLVAIRGRLVDIKTGEPPVVTPGTLEATAVVNDQVTSGNYLMMIFHPTHTGIKADGSFTLVVAAGKNRVSISDFQDYQRVAPGTRQVLIDRFLDFDIRAETQPEIVFRVRRAAR